MFEANLGSGPSKRDIWKLESKCECQGEACEKAEENQDVNLLEVALRRHRKRSQSVKEVWEW